MSFVLIHYKNYLPYWDSMLTTSQVWVLVLWNDIKELSTMVNMRRIWCNCNCFQPTSVSLMKNNCTGWPSSPSNQKKLIWSGDIRKIISSYIGFDKVMDVLSSLTHMWSFTVSLGWRLRIVLIHLYPISLILSTCPHYDSTGYLDIILTSFLVITWFSVIVTL